MKCTDIPVYNFQHLMQLLSVRTHLNNATSPACNSKQLYSVSWLPQLVVAMPNATFLLLFTVPHGPSDVHALPTHYLLMETFLSQSCTRGYFFSQFLLLTFLFSAGSATSLFHLSSYLNNKHTDLDKYTSFNTVYCNSLLGSLGGKGPMHHKSH